MSPFTLHILIIVLLMIAVLFIGIFFKKVISFYNRITLFGVLKDKDQFLDKGFLYTMMNMYKTIFTGFYIIGILLFLVGFYASLDLQMLLSGIFFILAMPLLFRILFWMQFKVYKINMHV